MKQTPHEDSNTISLDDTPIPTMQKLFQLIKRIDVEGLKMLCNYAEFLVSQKESREG